MNPQLIFSRFPTATAKVLAWSDRMTNTTAPHAPIQWGLIAVGIIGVMVALIGLGIAIDNRTSHLWGTW